MGSSTNATSSPGLEVALNNGPEQIAPSNIHLEDKYYDWRRLQEGKIFSNEHSTDSDPTNQPRNIDRQICGGRRDTRILAIFAIVCLVAALGAGLGGGLATQRKHSSAA